MNGFDGVIYAVSFLVGWPVILFFMAEKLRNLGKFTFADIAAYRLAQKRLELWLHLVLYLLLFYI